MTLDNPIAPHRRKARQRKFNPQPLIDRILELVEKHNESYREASLRSGLDHQTLNRIRAGRRPEMHICILLADHFGVNPNEFLALADWPELEAFSIHAEDVSNMPPEAVEVAKAVARIPDPGTRKQVSEAILTLIRKYFEA